MELEGNDQLRIEKRDKKWVIVGEGEGWVFGRTFPRKWKAEVALRVFKKGGKTSDYWLECHFSRPEPRTPWRVLERIEASYDRIVQLEPTCDEIAEYGKEAMYGEVTMSRNKGYFHPSIHDTWGEKAGGRVHIDIGCKGYHLMLNKYSCESFIDFIENKRSSSPK